ncbi:hypothetical protein Tco_1408823 [Tanacetum coccineum]
MANQEQNPSQQEQPFVATKQVGFNLEDIILNTNNEVDLLYPKHTNKDFFVCKALENSKVSFSIPTSGIYGEVGVNTFRNAIGAHYLPYSSEYVAPPSIDIVRKWFELIGYGETVSVKGTLKKSLFPPRWSLANGINIDYASIFWEDIIIKLNKKQREKVVPYTRFLSLLIMHKMKEGCFIIHFESASGYDASANSIVEADPRKSAPSDFIPQQQGMNEGTKNTSYDHLFAGASNIAKQIEEVEASSTIKLEDLAKRVQNVQPSFKDLNSLEDDPIIVVDDSDEDEEANIETEDASSQKHKLELEKNKAEVEVALLKAQHSFPNAGQLNELLVKSLQTEFSKILSAHDFSSSLPTKLKGLPSKFNELTEEVKGLKKQVHELEIKMPGDLKEIPTKLEGFTKTAKLKTLDALPSLLNKVTNALNQFAQAIASKKTEDTSIPSAGQAGTQPAEGEKNTNQTTTSQLFQRKAAKNANLTKQQSKPTPPPTTTIIPSVITTITTQMKSPSLQHPPKSSSQLEGEHIKKHKGKKAMSSEEAKKESTSSDFDDETHLTVSMKIEEEAKAKAAKRESEVRKEELVDLLGPEVVNKYYNDKLQYDRYCDNMLNRRAESRITNCDVLTKKGLITLKMYREDGTSEVIPNFKATNKRLKSSVQYEDHLADLKDFSNTMLYTVQEIFFRRHQGPGLNDHARTFNSLLLVVVDERNLNPLKQKIETFVSLLEGLQGGKKDCFMSKGIKQSPWEKLEFKFEGDNIPIVIQPPCYSASKCCDAKLELAVIGYELLLFNEKLK